MKYNEFVALSEQLKKDESSINEFVKENSKLQLFEIGEAGEVAPDTKKA